ncbi:GntR family transcriptional regulator [Geosporobacter ferrireducens]|uniref:GntR family transcriptional regulator n=1 Tax=Geosporobacter ferrireducens TaxID=1424294 RepID=A0A1D8GIG4_9FIRM|nr:GntR family transcriptional regulator [Geosporobacter ferrireducens]AOT70723.1 GntR family transcriptional regulator [Geosporobacter ferrireducens]MTI57527.1 GntR family transcriptional regulator [Geosporobacter ferrireducens]
MFQLDFKDRRPLYEQIKEKMKFLMINGVLKANEKIPSVRELAQTLTINPNTIQKSYKDLETEGFIYSIRGKGSFVTPLDNTVNQGRCNELMAELERIAAELMYLNVQKEQLIRCIDAIFQKGGNNTE